MTTKVLAERGQTNRAVARLLYVHENTVLYHPRRLARGAIDCRARQTYLAEEFEEAMIIWMERLDGDGPLNLVLNHWRITEHAFTCTLRSLQCDFRSRYTRPQSLSVFAQGLSWSRFPAFV